MGSGQMVMDFGTFYEDSNLLCSVFNMMIKVIYVKTTGLLIAKSQTMTAEKRKQRKIVKSSNSNCVRLCQCWLSVCSENCEKRVRQCPFRQTINMNLLDVVVELTIIRAVYACDMKFNQIHLQHAHSNRRYNADNYNHDDVEENELLRSTTALTSD